MASETSWSGQDLIVLSQSDLNLLNEYHSTFIRNFHLAQKFSNENLILLIADMERVV